MAGKFSMKDLLNAQSEQSASVPETSSRSIVDIPLDKLVPSPRNEYGIRDIEEIASSIEEIGLLHNLVVRRLPDCDKYEIISGERRYWGIKSLYDSGHTEWATIPCKIDVSPSDDMAELKLLIANCQTRTLTDYEKVYQGQRAKAIMLKLKQDGHKFTGRTRDNVATLIGVSSSQMGRIDSISNHLSDDFMEQFRNGHIGISAAYELSCLSGQEQEEAFVNYQRNGDLSVKAARDARKNNSQETAPQESENKLPLLEPAFIEPSPPPVPPMTPEPEAVPQSVRNEPKLKPCPFCGGEADINIFDALNLKVSCQKCKCLFIADRFSPAAHESLIAAWNRRYSGQ